VSTSVESEGVEKSYIYNQLKQYVYMYIYMHELRNLLQRKQQNGLKFILCYC